MPKLYEDTCVLKFCYWISLFFFISVNSPFESIITIICLWTKGFDQDVSDWFWEGKHTSRSAKQICCVDIDVLQIHSCILLICIVGY